VLGITQLLGYPRQWNVGLLQIAERYVATDLVLDAFE
jgi:hypothetical protein